MKRIYQGVAPSVYDPYHNLTLARQRQRIVVQCMVDNGVINKSQAEQILSEPLELKEFISSSEKANLILV